MNGQASVDPETSCKRTVASYLTKPSRPPTRIRAELSGFKVRVGDKAAGEPKTPNRVNTSQNTVPRNPKVRDATPESAERAKENASMSKGLSSSILTTSNCPSSPRQSKANVPISGSSERETKQGPLQNGALPTMQSIRSITKHIVRQAYTQPTIKPKQEPVLQGTQPANQPMVGSALPNSLQSVSKLFDRSFAINTPPRPDKFKVLNTQKANPLASKLAINNAGTLTDVQPPLKKPASSALWLKKLVNGRVDTGRDNLSPDTSFGGLFARKQQSDVPLGSAQPASLLPPSGRKPSYSGIKPQKLHQLGGRRFCSPQRLASLADSAEHQQGHTPDDPTASRLSTGKMLRMSFHNQTPLTGSKQAIPRHNQDSSFLSSTSASKQLTAHKNSKAVLPEEGPPSEIRAMRILRQRTQAVAECGDSRGSESKMTQQMLDMFVEKHTKHMQKVALNAKLHKSINGELQSDTIEPKWASTNPRAAEWHGSATFKTENISRVERGCWRPKSS